MRDDLAAAHARLDALESRLNRTSRVIAELIRKRQKDRMLIGALLRDDLSLDDSMAYQFWEMLNLHDQKVDAETMRCPECGKSLSTPEHGGHTVCSCSTLLCVAGNGLSVYKTRDEFSRSQQAEEDLIHSA